jgi:geranylgeranyl diphosphate synthase type II
MTSRKAVSTVESAEGLSLYLAKQCALVEAALKRSVPAATTRPATIHRAMRYSLLAGGKRLRPIFALAAAEAIAGESMDLTKILPAACAIELIHTYSLIHDDLPCMDDDDLRRGIPTLHKVFSEGVAVLAGDALLTQAFGLLAQINLPKRYPLAQLLKETAIAAGSLQLIAGQVADLEAEGKKLSITDVRFIHERKTAALIVLSLRLGAMTANATPSQLKALTEFGSALGLAFQIIDDVLDVTQSSKQLGKSAGKDLKDSKATYPAVIGLEASRKEAAHLTKKAHAALKPLGKNAERLLQIADCLLRRRF